MKVLYYYQLWQIPFLGGSFAYTMSNMLMFKKSLPRRLATSLIVGSVALSGHHYVGQYGLQKNIKSIFDRLTEEKHIERGSKLAIEAKEFEMNLNKK